MEKNMEKEMRKRESKNVKDNDKCRKEESDRINWNHSHAFIDILNKDM
jgi:hypothetical protein